MVSSSRILVVLMSTMITNMDMLAAMILISMAAIMVIFKRILVAIMVILMMIFVTLIVNLQFLLVHSKGKLHRANLSRVRPVDQKPICSS